MSPEAGKLWLFYLRSSHFAGLSHNVAREICEYIGSRLLIPCITGSLLRVFDLNSGYITRNRLSTVYDEGWTFCLPAENRVLAVKDRIAVEIQMDDCVESAVGEVNISRKWPGLGKYGDFVYAFGGNVRPGLISCEKYHKKAKLWTQIRDMFSPKSCFTPCNVKYELYLCSFSPDSSPFEAFNPLNETFRRLPVHFHSNLPGSVTFLKENTVYILGYEGVLVKWNVKQTELEKEVHHLRFRGMVSPNLTTYPVVSKGGKVYWVNYMGSNLVVLDVKALQIGYLKLRF